MYYEPPVTRETHELRCQQNEIIFLNLDFSYRKMGSYSSSENSIANDEYRSTLREDIGEVLFKKIKRFQEENAEKLTGMLLEMSGNELKIILEDDLLLKKNIDEANKVLYHQNNEQEKAIERKKALGEIIYTNVETVYPEQEMAEKITGILLEMSVEDIENLTQNKQSLVDKIHEAASVLISTENIEKNRRCVV